MITEVAIKWRREGHQKEVVQLAVGRIGSGSMHCPCLPAPLAIATAYSPHLCYLYLWPLCHLCHAPPQPALHHLLPQPPPITLPVDPAPPLLPRPVRLMPPTPPVPPLHGPSPNNPSPSSAGSSSSRSGCQWSR